jgi:hypothetical protein
MALCVNQKKEAWGRRGSVWVLLCMSGASFLCVHSSPIVSRHKLSTPGKYEDDLSYLSDSLQTSPYRKAERYQEHQNGAVTQSTQSGNGHFLAYTFHHDGKISTGWLGRGVHAHPLSLYLPSRTKLFPAERADILSIFLLYPYMYSVGCE